MVKKVLAALVLAFLAIFSVPAAALAAGYVPDSAIGVSGAVVPGGTVTISIPADSFLPGETVAFAISGTGTPSIAVVKAATASVNKTATPAGSASVRVVLPSNAAGTYNGTATGLTSGNVVTWTLFVSSASGGAASGESGGLPATGYQFPTVLMWSAVGTLLLGLALVVVLVMARRRHTTDS